MRNHAAITLLLLLLASTASSTAAEPTQGGNATLLFFWGDGCPHCEEEWKFIRIMQEKYPGLVVKDYEVWYNKDNANYLINVSQAFGVTPRGTPVTFIGEKYYNGFSWELNATIEQDIVNCINNGCVNPAEKCAMNANQSGGNQTQCDENIVSFTLLGTKYTIDPTKMSLPLFTLIIAGLDGFNPCAMWVLCFLLTLLVYTKSRSRMMLIGGTFILASGIVYFLFMTAWLNLFLYVGLLTPTRLIIGSLAAIAGLINIKDFIAFKSGPSLTIPDSLKPTILAKMRGIVNNMVLPAALAGTIILAFTVNMVELLCTAGFPAVYTRVLSMSNLSPLQHYLYIGLYNFIYMFDDLVVFTIAVVTLRSKKISEREGRWMKLISGLMMFTLGALLIWKPQLLMF